MASYSISDLEKISGIKAHTIRIWERRYKLIEPHRTPTNIRYYSDDDLKRLLNVSILSQNGFKISKIAQLNNDQLKNRVIDLCIDTRKQNVHIESLIISMLEFDEKKYTEVLTNSVIVQGFDLTIESLLFPFLERIGMLWQTGAILPAHEHYISNLIRQKILVAIDSEMAKYKKQGMKIVFFLPEGEFHEIGLLYYSLIARKENLDVIYLGASVPVADLSKIEHLRKANYFFTSFNISLGEELFSKNISQLSTQFPNQKIFISGIRSKELSNGLPDNFIAINSVDDFKKQLQSFQW